MKTFFGGYPNNGRHEKIFAQKAPKHFLGKIGKIREKILRTPKNLPASTPMDLFAMKRKLLPKKTMRLTRSRGFAYSFSINLFESRLYLIFQDIVITFSVSNQSAKFTIFGIIQETSNFVQKKLQLF